MGVLAGSKKRIKQYDMKTKAHVMVYYKSENTEGYRLRPVKYWFWESKSLAIARKIKEITEEFPRNHTVTGIHIF